MSISILINSQASLPATMLFVMIFNLLLFAAYKNLKKYPSFSALAGLLWLGFFCKTAALLTFGNGIKDPIGSFDGLGSQWSEVLFAASVGALGLLASYILYTRFIFKDPTKKTEIQSAETNTGLTIDFKLFFSFIFFLIFIAMVNFNYGLILSGLTSITQLPFKINAGVGWLLYLGFSIVLATFFMGSTKYKPYFYTCVALLFLEGFMSATSLISRGNCVFHIFPAIALIVANRKALGFSFKNIAIVSIFAALTVVVTIGTVTNARNYLYDKYAFTDAQFSTSSVIKQYQAGFSRNFFSNSIGTISDLVVKRWVGLEGTMAVVGYPNKSFSLMFDSLVRVPKIGDQDVFAEISGSEYSANPKISFSFIPGPIAFLYYSGMYISIFIGMFLIALLLLVADDIVWQAFKNPFLLVQMSAYLAVNASQFGMSPLPLVKSLVLTTIGLLGLKLVLSREVIVQFTYARLSSYIKTALSRVN